MTSHGGQRKKLTKAKKFVQHFTEESNVSAPVRKGGDLLIRVGAKRTYLLTLRSDEVITLLLSLPPQRIADAVAKANWFFADDVPEVIKQLVVGLVARAKAEAAAPDQL